jgi:hypothetical protein
VDAIVDTSVIIEIFKGNSKVLDSIRSHNLVYGISTVTLFELSCVELKEKEKLFLEYIPKLDFDSRCAEIGGMICRDLKRKGKTPAVKDC